MSEKLVISKKYCNFIVFSTSFLDGIQLVTKLKSNMKGALMSVSDKRLLRKRAIIETINDELKNIAQVEHSRHRCFDNFIVNLLLISYIFMDESCDCLDVYLYLCIR